MYFENCSTLEQLKAEYKRLAMMYHPDRGGDLRTMQAINSEYDSKFKYAKKEVNELTKKVEIATKLWG